MCEYCVSCGKDLKGHNKTNYCSKCLDFSAKGELAFLDTEEEI